MQSTTEHNLGLITKKTQNLEDQLSQQIEYVRQLQRDKETSTNEVMELRARLEAAEKRATKISQDFDDATSTLKSLTSEYSKAQLLQKRYRNAVAEQTGFCKAFVCIKGDESNGGRVSVPGALVLADECTLNLPGRWQRSVVVDGAIACNSASSAADQLVPSSIDSSIGDVLSGYNASIITFGSQGALKNTLMFGESQQQQQQPQQNNNSGTGLIQKSIRRLFSSLESNRVTHFSMRMSFGEVTAPDDQYKDLLSEYSNVLSIGRSPDVRCVPVQSEQEALSLVQLGLQRIGGGGTGNSNSSHHHQNSPNNQNFGGTNNNHPSHKFVVLTIENFDTRGHFRKGTLLFVDVAAPPVLFTAASSSSGGNKLLLQQQQLSGEQMWAQQSVAKLVESISHYASLSMNNNNNNNSIQQQTFSQIFNQNHNHSPNNNNNNKPDCLENPSGLLLLLSESLGGNSRTSFISCLDATNIVENNNNNSNGEIDASDNVVGTLNTALMMKNVRNSAMAFDVPAELQKLSMESENLAGVGN